MDERKRKRLLRALIAAGAFLGIVAIIAIGITIGRAVKSDDKGSASKAKLVDDETVKGEPTEKFYRFANFYLFGENSTDLIRSNFSATTKYYYAKFSEDDKLKFKELATDFVDYSTENDITHRTSQLANSVGITAEYARELLAFYFKDPNVTKDEIYSYFVGMDHESLASRIVAKYDELSKDENNAIQKFADLSIGRDNIYFQTLDYADSVGCLQKGSWREGQDYLSSKDVFPCIHDSTDAARNIDLMLKRYDAQQDAIDSHISSEEFYLMAKIFETKAKLQGEDGTN